MNVVLDIPDALAERLGGADTLRRRALEALATEEYRAGRLTASELSEILGLPTRMALDGFLKARGVMLGFTEADLAEDRETLARLGL